MFLSLTLCACVLSFARSGSNRDESPGDKTDVIFQDARKNIYRKDWQKAVTEFRRIVKEFSNSKYIEDSLYWLGYSLNKLGRSSVNFEKQLTLQQEALSELDTLVKRFPKGKWSDDAKLLVLEIAEDLAAKGLRNYKKYINNRAEEEQNLDIKMAAIDALMRTDQEKAFVILKNILSKDQDLKLKEKALFILSQSSDKRVVPLFVDIALKEKKRGIREQAIFWLGQLNTSRSLKELIKLYETIEQIEIKKKILFAIVQNGSSEAVTQLIRFYKKEKSLPLKKNIIFWLGQSQNKEAEKFIKDILANKP
jgi:outer membrane protein assembly factor BamD (BamD/ComL family)